MLSDDEVIYAATADAMRRGDVLYRDVVDHKPPGIYDVYLASFLALGPYRTEGAHALVIISVLLTAVFLAMAARRLFGDRRSGPTAALLWAVFSTAGLEYDSLAANCELFLVLPQTIALWWLVRADRRGGRRWTTWLGVGLLVGVVVVFKYQGATFAAVVAGAIGLDVLNRRYRALRAAGAAVFALLGFLVVPGLYVMRAWHAGSLDATWFWFNFNLSYVHVGPSGLAAVAHAIGRIGLIGSLAILAYVTGLWGAGQTVVDWARRRRSPDSEVPRGDLDARILAVLWLGSSAVALAAGGRFFGHYFHHVLPAFCLLAAGPLVAAWSERRSLRPVIVGLIAVPALVFLAFATVLRDRVIAATSPNPSYDRVVARLREVSAPEDRVFVWGNAPHVYVLAERPMGARFSFCNYLTGLSPGTAVGVTIDPRPNIVWAAWDMLFADLDRRRPRWLVDTAAGHWNLYGAYPMARYPRLDAYVRSHYVEREHVDGVVIYERTSR